MSTRVHELAKELGLKSQDLIDKIQKGGLDVKPSPLASLDPDMVSRIRDLVQQEPSAHPSPSPKAPTPAPPPPAGARSSSPSSPPETWRACRWR